VSEAERQWACRQQLVHFFDRLDARRYEEIPPLFDGQGVWARPGAVLQGRDAILAALLQRPANRRTRHIVANFLVDADRAGEVDARCMLATFAVDDEAASPRLVDALAGLYLARATLSCAGGETRFLRLELSPEMTIDRSACILSA
jgi:hypothetical protein